QRTEEDLDLRVRERHRPALPPEQPQQRQRAARPFEEVCDKPGDIGIRLAIEAPPGDQRAGRKRIDPELRQHVPAIGVRQRAVDQAPDRADQDRHQQDREQPLGRDVADQQWKQQIELLLDCKRPGDGQKIGAIGLCLG
ncbi:hypothetical protein CEE96_12410, partial [Lactobacillus crispatus]